MARIDFRRSNTRGIVWLILEAQTANMVGGRIKDVPKKVNNLNRENSRIIWTYIQDAGDKLVGKLPPSQPSPKGRILMLM